MPKFLMRSLTHGKTMSWILAALLFAITAPLLADGGVTFTDIAANNGAGITYQRTPSATFQEVIDGYANFPMTVPDFLVFRVQYPMKPRGVPGVALLDYDNDGDVDIYVTNGPGSANSLYSNQLQESGQVTFVDVATAAGVDATAQDSAGACFGDIDNDGDHDLYVTGLGEPNILYANNGDGTFTDITAASGVAGYGRYSDDCSMGDVNLDGLLDIMVANTYDSWEHREASNSDPHYPGYQHNVLFINQGGNAFADASAAAGVETVYNMAGPGLSGASWTWIVSFVDMDQDGDSDIIWADNQGPYNGDPANLRGFNRLFRNDGTGHFVDDTPNVGLDVHGSWMGLAFGDYNCDGYLDLFSSNLGHYNSSNTRLSQFFFGSASGQYTVPPILDGNPFGWGSSPLDYDNDGDLDVIYHGGWDNISSSFNDNPGTLMRNDGYCTGVMRTDLSHLSATDHRLRGVQGVATGDLNNDGFRDVVSASNFNTIPGNFFFTYAQFGLQFGGVIDPVASLQFTMAGGGGLVNLVASLAQFPNGNLSVELSNAESGNGWAKVQLRGSAGTLANGAANRDGIGAVMRFTPKNGKAVTMPVVAGSSYASQDALAFEFGLGNANKGDLDILWPGGTRNRLRDVHQGESLVIPEIPCSYDGAWASYQDYHACVTDALDGLAAAGAVDNNLRGRLLSSAISAYNSVN